MLRASLTFQDLFRWFQDFLVLRNWSKQCIQQFYFPTWLVWSLRYFWHGSLNTVSQSLVKSNASVTWVEQFTERKLNCCHECQSIGLWRPQVIQVDTQPLSSLEGRKPCATWNLGKTDNKDNVNSSITSHIIHFPLFSLSEVLQFINCFVSGTWDEVLVKVAWGALH